MGTFYFEADWADAGFYSAEQAGLLQAFIIRRGRNAAVTGDRYAEVDTGEANITLKNASGRFSLFNSGGSLYNYLRPNKAVRVVHYEGGARTDLFTGFTSNIVNLPDRKQARIEALDGAEFLKKRKGDDIGLQTDYAVSTAMYDLLQAAGYPATDGTEWIFPLTFPGTLGGSAIENNGDTIPYFWGQTDKSAWEQLASVAAAFAGDIYINASGVFSYAARWRQRSSVLTLTDGDVRAGSQPEQPWNEIRNYIRVSARPLTATAALTEIYRMYDAPAIEAGESITIWADFSYQGQYGPATAATTPVSTTDYTANTAADGSGSNRTANLSVTFTAYTTRAKVILENTGSDTLYVTLFKIRGTLLHNVNETAQIAEDATSIGDYEKRELKVSSPYLQEIVSAGYHADHSLTVYKDPRKVLWVRILNRLNIQLVADLFDVVTLDLTELGASGDYRVTYIEHDFKPKQFVTTWRLEPVISSGWVFPATFPITVGW